MEEVSKNKMENNVLIFDLSTEGLEPVKHRIVGITIKTALEEKIFTHRDEKEILKQFWEYVDRKNFDKIIGFNSDNFDVPMLIVRSIKHNIHLINIRERFIDLRRIIFGEERKKGTLQDFQNLLGIEILENGYAKMHMSLLWEAAHLKNLEEYLLQDVRITWKLYLRVREAGLID